MAVQVSSNTYIYRTATVPNAASPYAWCSWVRLDSDRNAAGAICALTTSGGVWIHGLRVDTDGTTLLLRVGGSTYSTGVSLTVGQWYHLAYTRSGNTFRVYVDGSEVLSQTTANSSTAAAYIQGSDGGAYVNASYADTLVANAAYDQSDVQAEMAAPLGSWANAAAPWAFWPLASDASDASGNSRPLTTNGTITWVAGRRRRTAWQPAA